MAVEARLAALEEQMADYDVRLVDVENRVLTFDTVVAIGRWLIPILTGTAGVLIGKYG